MSETSDSCAKEKFSNGQVREKNGHETNGNGRCAAAAEKEQEEDLPNGTK